MDNKFYVYEWFIVPTDEVFYVGKGCGNRFRATSGRNRFFKDMYRTHKCDVRIIEDNLYEEDAFQLEYDTIQWYKTHTDYRLTNVTDGGDGTKGLPCSPERKAMVSKFFKELWSDEEWKSKMISSRHNPDSTYQSEEFKKKISELVRGEKNPNYGNHWTEEMKDSLSKKQQASGRYVNEKNPNRKMIRCVETGEEFACIKFAKKKYNVKWEASFTAALDKPTRTATGLHWVSIPDSTSA